MSLIILKLIKHALSIFELEKKDSLNYLETTANFSNFINITENISDKLIASGEYFDIDSLLSIEFNTEKS